MGNVRKMPEVGKKYHHLTVLSRDANYVSPSGTEFSKWLCRCDCGNEVSVLGSSLVSGHTKSCGCLMKRYKVSDETMIGKRFGLLTVVSRAPSHKIPSGSVYDMWNCVCDCGRSTVSFGRNLRNGRTGSCGCERIRRQAEAKWTPKAESWTKAYLDDQYIDYEYQKTFSDLIGPNGGLLTYDFFLPDLNMCLELNGLQHYVAVEWFGGDVTLARQQANDAVKQSYAEQHGYRFVVIDTDHISHKSLIKKLDAVFFGI